MAEWERETLRLRANHGWKTKPGYQIVVLSRGAVRFDVPKRWVLSMDRDERNGHMTVKLTDRPEPDDDCRLQVTPIYLPPGVEPPDAPLVEMLEAAVSGPSENEELGRSIAIHERRRDLELAWIETRYVDPGEKREARARSCLARRADIHVLMTLDYWPEHRRRFLPIWDEVLRSLRLGEYVQDPTRGPDR